ncbi:unnamed protein product [Gongylonema pulchrum]|uniref:Glucuronosyltransferase n=1 Tax=Gongylonema pulchrum TaxID=637853 RepID=A0A183EAW3_9BILA|nr:unnamed protein product [Gongylonema pulchrum]
MRTALRVYDALRSDAAVFPVITGKDVQNIRAIAVDHQNTAVFWSDDVKDAVTKVYLNGTSGEKTVVWKGCLFIYFFSFTQFYAFFEEESCVFESHCTAVRSPAIRTMHS